MLSEFIDSNTITGRTNEDVWLNNDNNIAQQKVMSVCEIDVGFNSFLAASREYWQRLEHSNNLYDVALQCTIVFNYSNGRFVLVLWFIFKTFTTVKLCKI